MGVDKTTEPTYINIVFDGNKDYISKLKKQADSDDQNDEKDNNKLSITNDGHNFEMEEYYYDEPENEIYISGVLQSDVGSSGIYLSIPLSDIVLIDIIQGAIKKLNKLKTALEALK